MSMKKKLLRNGYKKSIKNEFIERFRNVTFKF